MKIPSYSSAEESPEPPSPPPELPPELPLETPPPAEAAGAPPLGDPTAAGAAVGVVVIAITLGTACVAPVMIFLPDFASSFILFSIFLDHNIN